MGFVTDAVGITGSGPKNNFNATAPTNDFQATGINTAQNNYQGTIAQGQGIAGGVAPQQQMLARQLQAQAAGQGPSLAQAQLQAATQQQQAQAAGAIGSTRGLNPAMQARLISQQQSALGQQAAGQSAQLRMQEQMGARQQLAGVLGQEQQGGLGMMAGAGQLQQGQNALNVQQNLGVQGLNQATAAQNAQLNLGAQQVNAGIAGQNAATNAQVLGGIMNAGATLGKALAHGGVVPGRVPHYAGGGLTGISGLQGLGDYGLPTYGTGSDAAAGAALAAGMKSLDDQTRPQMPKTSGDSAEQTKVAPDSSAGSGPGGGGPASSYGSPYESPWPGAAPLLGGEGAGGAGGAGALGGADAGAAGAGDYGAAAAGGESAASELPALAALAYRGGQVQPSGKVTGPASHLGRYLKGLQVSGSPTQTGEATDRLARGGSVDSVARLDRFLANTSYLQGKSPKDFRAGGGVPGQATVQGDSERNDTVPAMVSPGEVVLPRSVTEAPDAPARAAEFVRRLQRRSGKSRGFERVARARKGAR